MINKIASTIQVNNVQNTRRSSGTTGPAKSADSISISAEAKEMMYLKQVAAETPDVRADKIAEIKAKIKDPTYLNSAVIASAADRIMDSFGI